MFRLEVDGVSYLHIGDNRVEWPTEVAQAVGDVDVLMVTVDDSIHLLTYDQVDSLVQRLEPRVVVPMHYAIPRHHIRRMRVAAAGAMAGTAVDGAPARLPPHRFRR